MKIYLAGPDVFRNDASEWAENSRILIEEHGHQALIPLDNTKTTAKGIFNANLNLINEADAILANLNPFRGLEPDSGTAFEIGYATALGKTVIGYLNDRRSQIEKLSDHFGLLIEKEGRYSDPEGLSIENFNLPVNLMLAESSQIIEGNLESALNQLGRQHATASP